MHSVQIWQERSLKDVLMQGQISGLIKNGFYLEKNVKHFLLWLFWNYFQWQKSKKHIIMS